MITIVEPQEHIITLWGKQKATIGKTYRLMRYILRVDYDGKVLLHNVVTGQLVVLARDEAELIGTLPSFCSPALEQLVTDHFLVPEDFDEHQQVKSIRSVLRILDEVQGKKEINHYTILPTTACNARCYYCFEQGVKTVTMSEETANDVVEFITGNYNQSESVHITWFGGEPTVATHRIDQICGGLRGRGVGYWSDMTTNGFLFDELMVYQAKELWNLKLINIAMDGTGRRYNDIKAFVNPCEDPYQRVMRNIGLLLAQEIRVNLRMNFDMGNYDDFKNLVSDILERFGTNRLLNVSAHQVNGDFPCDVLHGNSEWFSKKIVELNDLARAAGLYRKAHRLPALIAIGCKASMDSTVTITPEGYLVRCPEQFGDDQITGNVRDGVTNKELVQSWKQLCDYDMCSECRYYPKCLHVLRCTVKERCSYKEEYNVLYRDAIIKRFIASKEAKKKEE